VRLALRLVKVLFLSVVVFLLHFQIVGPVVKKLPATISYYSQYKTPEHQAVAHTMRQLIVWINDNTYYRLDVVPMFYFSSTDPRLRGNESLHVSYEAKHSYILLRRDVDYTLEEHQRFLVHELVHRAQFVEGKTYDCHGQLEAEAYRIENRFVESGGSNAYTTPVSTIELLEQCIGVTYGNR